MGEIDFGVVIAQIINFCILLSIFYFFIAKKLEAIMEERDKVYARLSHAEEEYSRIMTESQLNKEKILLEAKKDALVILSQAEIIATQKRETLIKEAQAEVLTILDGGKRQVEKERFQMIENSRQYVLGLAFKINQKLLGNKVASKDLIEEELKNM